MKPRIIISIFLTIFYVQLVFADDNQSIDEAFQVQEEQPYADSFNPSLKFENEHDIILGDPNAPILFVEYFSPTCAHCAYYMNRIFPKIKERYIDTGKIRYVKREAIGNKQDLDASVLIRCTSNQDDRLNFIKVILDRQNVWAYSSQYRDILTNIGQIGNVAKEEYVQCLEDEKIIIRLMKNTDLAFRYPGFVGTPSFFINGELFIKPYTLHNLSQSIEEALNNNQG
ncbi:MAG: DsbA family protein [Rickettsiaceae bacterium]